MKDEMECISHKIMENSDKLAENLSHMQQRVSNHLTIDFHRGFFRCLGESLTFNDDHTAHGRITQWFSLLPLGVTPSPFPSHLYHSVLLNFLEEEASLRNISSKILIKVMKRVSDIIQFASSIFSPTSNQEMLEKDRIPLEDERITIQELSDLKNALKEATILAITDRDDIIRYANKRFCQITKYSSEELIGQNHHDLLYSGYHHDEFLEDIRESIKTGRVWKGEICNKAKDGSFYWVDTTIVPFMDKNGKTYQHISIQHDITEQKNTEDMLRKTEKLSLVGELAAGFAHEIRNPLTTIRGFVQILDRFSEEKKFLYSKTILEEIDRINFIVSEFMVFAKPHAVYFSEINIIEIVKSVINLLGAEAAMKNVKIYHSFHQEKVFIYGEKNQLTQVFLNMLKNAIDALPYGGQINSSIALSENHVKIRIKDNGVGMTKEQIDRIGEPFYTTKDSGNGLGLMVSYKIIESHRGKIEVESELNKGTTFQITFPLLSKN